MKPIENEEMVREDVRKMRVKRWSSAWRMFLLRIALGPSTFDYMLRSIKLDHRTPGAKAVDIVIRQDAREVRVEADWVKTIARWACHLPSPPMRDYVPVHRRIKRWWLKRFPEKVYGNINHATDVQNEGQNNGQIDHNGSI